jgi:cellulose synthase/poly-beta-1,6-N-acetylglucosamine synthase-like glycosyltransferase
MTPSVVESIVRFAVLSTYFSILGALAVYGMHRWYLLALYHRHRRRAVCPPARFDDLPALTVQLPVYNERYVVDRLVDAVCALDYPRDKLEIQVLDDSTDDTVEIARRAVDRKRAAGFNITHIHRKDRTGFKAGALQAGLEQSSGELVAIFDADFVPPRNFAAQLVHYFTDDCVGMVQARWGHLNREHSALTHVQSMFLDGHFVIEQTARNRSGRFFNFNGTAGIWRRSCIESAGGWQHDTLTEDLDLSYRAQLKSWKFVFLPDEVAPAELPVEMGAFKSQQHRWAKGSIQTAKKLLPRLLRSRLPLSVKTEAVAHLTANVCYVLMILLTVLIVPAAWVRRDVSPWLIAAVDVPLLTFSSVSVVYFYGVARREAVGTLRGAVRFIPFLMAVGIGLGVNNTRAVLEALFGHSSEFHRTPKYNLRSGEGLETRQYRCSPGRDIWIEGFLAVYLTVGVVGAAVSGLWVALPFMVLFQLGFVYTVAVSLLQARGRARRRPRGACVTGRLA